MKKLMGAALITTLFSGCIFEDDNLVITDLTSNTTPTPAATATPAPSATATPGASATPSPSSSPAATPTPTATPGGPVVSSSPTPSPSSAPTPTPTASATPTPSTTPTPTPSSGTAKACFKPVLLTPGSSYSWTLKRDDNSVTVTDDRSVTSGTFNGQSATKTVSNMTTSNGSPSSTDTYQTMDEAASLINVLGTETTSPAAVTITFDPSYELRFNLQPGESYDQTYRQHINSFGFAMSQDVSMTRTFLGIKSVSVPGGTFQACHFKQETSIDGGAAEPVETWVDTASGLVVQQLNSDGTRDQLTEGEVNGDPVP